MNKEHSTYDSSWDEDNEELFDKKYAEWENRNWESWLSQNLTFPFEAKCIEDEEGFGGRKSKKSFGIGHVVTVLSIFEEDDLCGIIIKVREGRKTGYGPLCDFEVASKDDSNYWPVREYVVWFANH
ncbi:MAG: hypothetical protein EOL88_13350 [Bacteroidia bacterium]|nr:hypothetical protein [Bacteroidia bacterium]